MDEPNDDQRKILCWEDHIVPILEHPDIHIRDKALVAVAWESHARGSELHPLRYGDVEDLGDHMTILITGPKGHDRKLALYGSMPYLKKWVQEEHPVSEGLATDADPLKEADPSTPIWTEKVRNKQLPSLRFLTVPEEACKRAGIKSRIAFHDIRRSRAKLLGSKHGLDLWTQRARFGWLRDEPEDLVDPVEDDATSEDIKPRTPIQCYDCGAWAPREQPCPWCGTNPSTQS